MSQKQQFLLELPANFDRSELKNITTLKQLEAIAHRMGHTVESNLAGRIFVYEENAEKSDWKCEPKFKRIYKYVKRNKLPKVWKGKPMEINVRSLKKPYV